MKRTGPELKVWIIFNYLVNYSYNKFVGLKMCYIHNYYFPRVSVFYLKAKNDTDTANLKVYFKTAHTYILHLLFYDLTYANCSFY